MNRRHTRAAAPKNKRRRIGDFPKTKPARSGKRGKVKALRHSGYPEGWFTAPFRATSRRPAWPPGFDYDRAGCGDDSPSGPSIATRERMAESGVGWGKGTVQMAGTPQHQKRPGWMR